MWNCALVLVGCEKRKHAQTAESGPLGVHPPDFRGPQLIRLCDTRSRPALLTSRLRPCRRGLRSWATSPLGNATRPPFPG
eukprot:14143082-Alexandrium_andersonii.AAC.1